jgi:hypothetical protein
MKLAGSQRKVHLGWADTEYQSSTTGWSASRKSTAERVIQRTDTGFRQTWRSRMP